MTARQSLDIPPASSGVATSAASTVVGSEFAHEKAHDSASSHSGTDHDHLNEKDVVEASEEQTPDESIDDTEYPTGMKLFFIVLALIFSIFLLALDMVSHRRCSFSTNHFVSFI